MTHTWYLAPNGCWFLTGTDYCLGPLYTRTNKQKWVVYKIDKNLGSFWSLDKAKESAQMKREKEAERSLENPKLGYPQRETDW